MSSADQVTLENCQKGQRFEPSLPAVDHQGTVVGVFVDVPDSPQEVQEGRGMSGDPKVGPGDKVILFDFPCLA